MSTAPTAQAAKPKQATTRRRLSPRHIVFGLVAIVGVAVALYVGIPLVDLALNTVSTDDAYVNGHVTYVAARVPGQVVKVLVDDNNRVKKGDILVELDKQPYQIDVDLKKAIVATAQANLLVAKDDVARWSPKPVPIGSSCSTRSKMSTIKSPRCAPRLRLCKPARPDWRAQGRFESGAGSAKNSGAISPQEVDLREEAYRVADAQVRQSLEQVYQIRVGLGLPAQAEAGKDLSNVPENLDQTFSTVREALAQLLQSAPAFGHCSAVVRCHPQRSRGGVLCTRSGTQYRSYLRQAD